MAGGIAHDLNNILSGIVSYPDLLLSDLPEADPLRKPIEMIKESGQRAADVVSELLTIARGVSAVREVINLNTIIEEFLSSAEYKQIQSTNPSIALTKQFDPDILNISCSPFHIEKCLLNLVINAYDLGLGWVSFHIGGMPRQSWHSAVCQKSACAYDSEGYF
jgi:signal transduction histidine kinase